MPTSVIGQQIATDTTVSTMQELLYIPWPNSFELVTHNDNGNRIDVQFYPKGQNQSSWKEAGLVSVLKNRKLANLEEFMLDNNSVLLSTCQHSNYKLIMHKPTGKMPFIVYTFYYENCGQDAEGNKKLASRPQAWVCIVVQGKQDLFIGQYGVKQDKFGPLQDKLLNEKVKMLASGRLVPMPVKKP